MRRIAMHPDRAGPEVCLKAAAGLVLLLAMTGPVASQSLEKLPGNIRDVTPGNMLRLPELKDGYVERVAPKAVVRLQPPPRPDVWAQIEVIEAGRMRSGETEIRIAGVTALAASAACGSNASAWPCGRFARAAFQRLIRRRPIRCEPAAASDRRIITSCQVGGLDLAAWLVRQGWAVPDSSATNTATLLRALDEARRNRAGQWRDDLPAFAEF